MTRYLVGTASWTDKSLVDSGKFYPPEVKTSEDRLRFYASLFPLVEVDSSYYGLPAAQSARLWAERTPATFRFNVKAFRFFTGHQTPPVALPKDLREALGPITAKNLYYKDVDAEIRDELWSRFRHSLAPLRAAGKLEAVHFQFPPWTAFRPESLAHLEECQAQMSGFRLAVEFRNRSWFTEQNTPYVLDFERERGMVNVIVDEPQGFSNSIPAVWEVTCPELAIVRLHGRNAETWNKKGLSASSQRFDFDYSDTELGEMAHLIEKLEGVVHQVDVIFNNNYQDQGQRNACTMAAMLPGAVAGSAG